VKLPDGWRVYRGEVYDARGPGFQAWIVEHMGATHSSHHTAGQAFRAVEHATGALLRPQGAPFPDGWAVRAVEVDGAPRWAVERAGVRVEVCSSRRAAMRRARRGDGPADPSPWTAAAEHPTLGASERDFTARGERAALRRARVLLRAFAAPGWVWRLYAWRRAPDGLMERSLVASRRAESVRAWRRPVVVGVAGGAR